MDFDFLIVLLSVARNIQYILRYIIKRSSMTYNPEYFIEHLNIDKKIGNN